MYVAREHFSLTLYFWVKLGISVENCALRVEDKEYFLDVHFQPSLILLDEVITPYE